MKLDYEYKNFEDPSKVVPSERRIKGYQYGPHVVPISSAEWDAVKFKPEKGIKLLGFTNTSNIMRYDLASITWIYTWCSLVAI